MSKVRRLFWDIETSPNVGFFWSSGYKVNIPPDNIIQERAIICICFKWEGEKQVHYLQWDGGCDREMIREFIEVASFADEMVAHNGDKFDMAWYNGRHLIHGFDPMPNHKTVDTYKMAAKNFNLNSYKLDYLSKILLGEGKIHAPFQLWEDIVKSNCPKAMKKMIAYCKKDVVLLERVWQKLSAYEEPMTHAGVYKTGDVKKRWTCPHCGSENVYKSKTNVTRKGMAHHQMQCNDCGKYYTIVGLVYKWYREAREATV